VEVTQEDLQKQFDLAWKIRNELDQANVIVSKIRQIRKQVNDRLKESSDAGLKSEAGDLLAKQKMIEETVYQTKNRSNQDPLNFTIRLNNYIATLDKSVMMGDAAPTAQAYEVDKELTGRLEVQQKAFDQTVDVELGKLNETLRAKKLKPVVVSIEM
jgi:hypothetical protein